MYRWQKPPIFAERVRFARFLLEAAGEEHVAQDLPELLRLQPLQALLRAQFRLGGAFPVGVALGGDEGAGVVLGLGLGVRVGAGLGLGFSHG